MTTRTFRRPSPADLEADALAESMARHPSRCTLPVAPVAVTVIRDPRGGRNYIRKGDTVHVDPSQPGKHDGFDARFIGARVDGNGNVIDVEVYGARRDRAPALRTLRPERIRRTRRTVRGS